MKKNAIYTGTFSEMKYLVINLTKFISDLLEDNYKTLTEEVRGDLNNWRKCKCMLRGEGSRSAKATYCLIPTM